MFYGILTFIGFIEEISRDGVIMLVSMFVVVYFI